MKARVRKRGSGQEIRLEAQGMNDVAALRALRRFIDQEDPGVTSRVSRLGTREVLVVYLTGD